MILGSGAALSQVDVVAVYQTRAPRTCPSRAEPSSGPPTLEQARQYFICDSEIVAFDGLHLLTDVTLQIGSGRRFNPEIDSVLDGADPAQTVYPIRGTYTDYTCFLPHDATYLGGGAGKNCHRAVFVGTTGACYRTSFGDWHCGYMNGGRKDVEPGWPLPMHAPPTGG